MVSESGCGSASGVVRQQGPDIQLTAHEQEMTNTPDTPVNSHRRKLIVELCMVGVIVCAFLFVCFKRRFRPQKLFITKMVGNKDDQIIVDNIENGVEQSGGKSLEIQHAESSAEINTCASDQNRPVGNGQKVDSNIETSQSLPGSAGRQVESNGDNVETTKRKARVKVVHFNLAFETMSEKCSSNVQHTSEVTESTWL